MEPDRRRFLSALLLTGAWGVLAACGDPSPAAPVGDPAQGQSLGSPDEPVSKATITSPDSTFDITTVHAPAGRPVEFTYRNLHEGVPHNLHVAGKDVDSMTPVRPGEITQALTVTFPEPGRYDYICDVHPETMRGVVIVV